MLTGERRRSHAARRMMRVYQSALTGVSLYEDGSGKVRYS